MAEQKGDAATEMQLVVFDLASEFYGVDIGDVREIIRMQTVTRGPGAPPYVEGIINLRGQVIPVVDLRKRLELAVGEQTNDSRIVWVTINGQDVGVIVDAVTEVLRIPLLSIEPPSSMVSSVDSDYLRGIAKLENKLIILLDLGKVLSMLDSQKIISSIEAAGEEALQTTEEPLPVAGVEEPEPVSDVSKKKKLTSVSSTS